MCKFFASGCIQPSLWISLSFGKGPSLFRASGMVGLPFILSSMDSWFLTSPQLEAGRPFHHPVCDRWYRDILHGIGNVMPAHATCVHGKDFILDPPHILCLLWDHLRFKRQVPVMGNLDQDISVKSISAVAFRRSDRWQNSCTVSV